MPQQITIITGARLHFGLLSHGLEGTRRFGGVGLMIDSPNFELRAQPAERTTCDAPDELSRRVIRLAAAYRENSPPEHRPPPCRFQLRRSVPPHVGLGSGTQLGMAVAQALSLLAGDDEADPVTLALRVGRGLRSAVGVHGFGSGGLIVDEGKTTTGAIGSMLQRVAFPSAWRLILVMPRGVEGFSGKAEKDAFKRLPPMPAATTQCLREVLLQELLPAVTAGDFDACGDSLYRYGRIVGEYFAPLQGGVYADRRMEQLAAHLRKVGLPGVGQSSWGPTLFALCQSLREAESLRDALADDKHWDACDFRIVGALNDAADAEAV